jgi:hypothetical protein
MAFEKAHPENAAALAPWRAEQVAVRTDMRENVLPHNRAILFNTLAVCGMLLLSSSADVAWLMGGCDRRLLRVVSTGTFVTVLVPLLETAVRYFLALRMEFAHYRQAYQAPPAEPGAK